MAFIEKTIGFTMLTPSLLRMEQNNTLPLTFRIILLHTYTYTANYNVASAVMGEVARVIQNNR
jgi:hypothetical protein